MKGSSVRNVIALLGLVVATASASTIWGQIPSPKESELIGQLSALLREKKYDDAIALARTEARHTPPHKDSAAALFVVGQSLLSADRPKDSLPLFEEITERFADSAVASYAWCGLGQAQGRLGNEAEMIPALERGMAARRVMTMTNIMDASDTHNRAAAMLGGHYLKTSQWEKALQTYLEWKPQSWCGTCEDDMRAQREAVVELLLIRLGRADEAAVRAWKNLATRGNSIAALVLIRLYVEANQIKDLRALFEEFSQSAERRLRTNAGDKPVDWQRLRTVQMRGMTLEKALDLFESGDVKGRLEVFQAKEEEQGQLRQLRRSVAAWLFIRDAEKSVPVLFTSLQEELQAKIPLLEILAAIDTPSAREALVALAIHGDVYQQQTVCGMIRARVKKPQVLIDQISAQVPDGRERFTTWGTETAPFEQQFYLSWPQPKPGSLPKSLPDDLWKPETR